MRSTARFLTAFPRKRVGRSKRISPVISSTNRGKNCFSTSNKEKHMPEHKGKPSGKYSETKTGVGRKRDYQRTGWPEDAPTQRSEPGSEVEGRNKKAGSPR